MTPATELPDLTFDLGDNAYCCGMLDLGSFQFRGPDYYASGRYDPNAKVRTRPAAEVLKQFDEGLRSAIWDSIGGNENSNNDGYYYVQCSLIESNDQFAALVQHFKDKKWKLVTEFQNHNTKNTVYAFGKKFKFSALKRDYGEDYKEDDDSWGW